MKWNGGDRLPSSRMTIHFRLRVLLACDSGIRLSFGRRGHGNAHVAFGSVLAAGGTCSQAGLCGISKGHAHVVGCRLHLEKAFPVCRMHTSLPPFQGDPGNQISLSFSLPKTERRVDKKQILTKSSKDPVRA